MDKDNLLLENKSGEIIMRGEELLLEDEPEIICVSASSVNRCYPNCHPYPCKPTDTCIPQCTPSCAP